MSPRGIFRSFKRALKSHKGRPVLGIGQNHGAPRFAQKSRKFSKGHRRTLFPRDPREKPGGLYIRAPFENFNASWRKPSLSHKFPKMSGKNKHSPQNKMVYIYYTTGGGNSHTLTKRGVNHRGAGQFGRI